jgi:hypothetical protein
MAQWRGIFLGKTMTVPSSNTESAIPVSTMGRLKLVKPTSPPYQHKAQKLCGNSPNGFSAYLSVNHPHGHHSQ